jgi:CRP-like cAMP-binding protein
MSINKLVYQRMFRNLSEGQLHSVLTAGNIFSVDRGEVLIQEGQRPRHLYFILDGEVDVFTKDDAADEASHKLLTTLGPGDSVGEYGFVDGRPASASVQAADVTELFALTLPVFAKLLESDSDLERVIYKNLLSILVDRLRTTNVIIDFLRDKEEDDESGDLH